jgi:hypothetical protein
MTKNDEAPMTKNNLPTSPSITIEFYGIPRERAGLTEWSAPAGTLADVLSAVARQCPRLQDLVGPGGAIGPHYRVSLDGQRFVTDMDEILPAGSHLLVLSADAGG